MDRITKSLLDTFSGQNDLTKLEESTQFEHFVNYCITSKLNRTSFELDDIHTGSRNASKTKPAKFLVFLLKAKDAPVLVPVK